MNKSQRFINSILREKSTSFLLIFSFILIFLTVVNGIALIVNLDYRRTHAKKSNYNGNYYNFMVEFNYSGYHVDDEVNKTIGFEQIISKIEYAQTNILITDSNLTLGNGDGRDMRVDIMLSYNTDLDEKIIEGKMPPKHQLNNNDKYVFINDNARKIVVKDKTGIDVVKISGEYYKVIGYYECDDFGPDAITFFDCLSDNTKNMLGKIDAIGITSTGSDGGIGIRIYGDNKKAAREEIGDYVISYGYNINEKIDLESMTLNNKYKIEKLIMVLLYVFCIIDSMVVCDLWLDSRKKNFVIMKAFGISSVKISLNMAKYMLAYSLLAFLISIIIQSIIGKRTIMYNVGIANLGEISMIVIMSIMIVVIIMLLVSFIKISKIVPAYDIRK